MLIWACMLFLFSANPSLYLPIRVERRFFYLVIFTVGIFYRFHQTELVRLAALSAEMKILGELSGSCFVYSNSAVFDLNIFPGVWSR